MLRFDNLPLEQKLKLAKMSPELAEELDRERAELQEQLDNVFTLEKQTERAKEIKKEIEEKLFKTKPPNQGDLWK